MTEQFIEKVVERQARFVGMKRTGRLSMIEALKSMKDEERGYIAALQMMGDEEYKYLAMRDNINEDEYARILLSKQKPITIMNNLRKLWRDAYSVDSVNE